MKLKHLLAATAVSVALCAPAMAQDAMKKDGAMASDKGAMASDKKAAKPAHRGAKKAAAKKDAMKKDAMASDKKM
jgi:pentapeptide MXKDX repeat protein